MAPQSKMLDMIMTVLRKTKFLGLLASGCLFLVHMLWQGKTSSNRLLASQDAIEVMCVTYSLSHWTLALN